jgi:hypothetical protein
MLQLAGPSTIAPPTPLTQEIPLPPALLPELQARAMNLEMRVADLAMRVSQIREQRDQAPGPNKAQFNKLWADAQHDLTAASIELDATKAQLARLEKSQEWQLTQTIQPPPDPWPSSDQIRMGGIGAFLLTVPLVIAFARRIWVRGSARAAVVDFDSSPRLQRIEQAIESIAIEVERIGEAQRFTTKLLSDRAADPVANRIPSAPSARHDLGTITPH